MYSAIGVDPTKLTADTSGWVIKQSTASLSPLITLKTPSGKPASFSKSPNKINNEGSFSEGFKMKQIEFSINFSFYFHVEQIKISLIKLIENSMQVILFGLMRTKIHT